MYKTNSIHSGYSSLQSHQHIALPQLQNQKWHSLSAWALDLGLGLNQSSAQDLRGNLLQSLGITLISSPEQHARWLTSKKQHIRSMNISVSAVGILLSLQEAEIQGGEPRSPRYKYQHLSSRSALFPHSSLRLTLPRLLLGSGSRQPLWGTAFYPQCLSLLSSSPPGTSLTPSSLQPQDPALWASSASVSGLLTNRSRRRRPASCYPTPEQRLRKYWLIREWGVTMQRTHKRLKIQWNSMSSGRVNTQRRGPGFRLQLYQSQQHHYFWTSVYSKSNTVSFDSKLPVSNVLAI